MYRLLEKRRTDLPEGLRRRISYMIADNWLMKFTTFEGLEEAFGRVEKAAAFPGNFGNAAEHLMAYLEDFNTEFLQFFPQLQKHVAELL
jgi:acyl carrier protein phosphodiesterase